MIFDKCRIFGFWYGIMVMPFYSNKIFSSKNTWFEINVIDTAFLYIYIKHGEEAGAVGFKNGGESVMACGRWSAFATDV